MTIAFRAQSLGPLRAIDWAIPSGVSVVVGPNRVGKSTLLRLPELMKVMLIVGLNEAFKTVFEGVPHRNFSMPPSTPMKLGVTTAGRGLAVGRADWEVEVVVSSGQLADLPREHFSVDGSTVLWRKFGSKEIEGKDYRFPPHAAPIPSLALRVFVGVTASIEDGDMKAIPTAGDPDLVQKLRKYLPSDAPDSILHDSAHMVDMLACVTRARTFRTYHYEINHLLRFGSVNSSALELQPTGENVFPLLRNWRDRPDLEERYEFVLTTMREIFPYLGRIGFETAGQTVTMNVIDRRWPGNPTIPIARESTGFITALLQLCALASCPPHGLVTLDEIETSLHPRAIRLLVEACRTWAAKHDLRVVLATQSETVLDQFRDEPSQVFVLEPNQETSPKALTELFSPEYLSQFSLGDLFAHLEFGSDPTDEQSA